MEQDSPLIDSKRDPMEREVLLAYLERHRTGVLVAVGIAMAALLTVLAWPQQILGAFGNGGWTDWWSPILVVLAFVLLQSAFLFGGLRLETARRTSLLARCCFGVVIAAALMALLTSGAICVFLEFGARFEPPLTAPAPAGSGTWLRSMTTVIGGGWLVWTAALGWHVYRRGEDRHRSVLWKLLEIVFAGSWAEFLVAATMHLTLKQTRAEESDCRCDQGTWFALCFSFPIMVWTLGPAVVLLYVREQQLRTRSPARWLRLLVDRVK